MSLSPRDVIKRAARLNGSIASGEDPTADELADAMVALNTMKRAMFGTFIGPRLSSLPASGATWQAENGGEYQIVPWGSPIAVSAPLNPRSGARFGIADAGNGFATQNCSVSGNGRLLQGSATPIVFNTNGAAARWWYRGDAGDWVREADYVSADDVIEFPDNLIAYLPYMLAVTVGPEFGVDLRQDVIAAAAEGRQAFARAYSRRSRSAADAPIGLGAGQPQQEPQGR
jgi:hypothetical protein